jgi:DDE superfamily endonuclease
VERLSRRKRRNPLNDTAFKKKLNMDENRRKLLLVYLYFEEELLAYQQAVVVLSIGMQMALLILHKDRAVRRRRRRPPSARRIRTLALTGPTRSALSHFIENSSAEGFKEYFRLDRATFNAVLERFSVQFSGRNLVSRRRVANARTRSRACTAEHCLALTLRYLAAGLASNDQMVISGLSRSSRSRYAHLGVACLYAALRSFRDIRVRWTRSLAEASAARAPHFLQNMCAIIDGKQHELERSGDPRVQRVTYNGYKCINNLKGLYIFYLDGSIARARLAPGTWHDARVLDTWGPTLSLVCMGSAQRNQLWICGDSAFSTRAQFMRTASSLGTDASAEVRRMFNASRTTSEYGIYDLTRGWRVLGLPLPADDPDHVELVWRSCLMLHNIRVRWMGIGHILHAFH